MKTSAKPVNSRTHYYKRFHSWTHRFTIYLH